MLGIVIMTSLLGMTLGWAAAIAMGVVASGICIAVMLQHHRRGAHDERSGASHDHHHT